jgi:hypothetical protein
MTVDAARAAVAAVERDLAAAVEERNRLLLTDDDDAVARVDSKIEGLKHRQRTATDRAALVFAEAERQAAEKRAGERSELVKRIGAPAAPCRLLIWF